mmetsp:Transcript_29628/g.91206  ORF Transcript_29628/g.91206 Transcript_29628/m.91206 type:complete len:462 (-) Transcript_29628:265-1650(-)
MAQELYCDSASEEGYAPVAALGQEQAPGLGSRSLLAGGAGAGRLRWRATAAALAAALLGAAACAGLLGRGRSLPRSRQDAALEMKAAVHDKGASALLAKNPEGAQPNLWCHSAGAPKLWKANTDGKPYKAKILSYNLFWWNLYEDRGSNGNSAGWLIKGSMQDRPYDFMGFQECKNPWSVLSPVGLLQEYNVLQGMHDTCAAYRKTWQMLAHGVADVSEDLPHNFYGRRGTLWMRLKHTSTGQTVLFLNHHGPLSINSGGVCGGKATAENILKIAATHGKKGDAIILVGDFNANAASLTIQTLQRHLKQVFNGLVFGGIDNIFANVDLAAVVSTKKLGSGGSDHNALSTVLQLGKGADADEDSKNVTAFYKRPWKALSSNSFDDKNFFCGLMEQHVEYAVSGGFATQKWGVKKPDVCCKKCQETPNCKWWTFYEGGACWVKGGGLVKRTWKWGVVSGRPYR